MSTPLVDPFGRVVRDLRISVTDRCNFRCTYCMPEEGMVWLPRSEVLTFEEIERVARVCVERFGFNGIRITGGEPTVRAHLPVLVAKLAALGVDLAMTTNGASLPLLVDDLRAAGLGRLNISCDSLRPERFAAMTRRDALPQVLEGIAAAQAAGFDPVKVNVVLVPNTYLETPNYKVQRLRHDDLNQAEPLPPSFTMMERPEEEDPLKQRQEDAKEPRQEAMVKGITSGQPAPMPIERIVVVTQPENWFNKVLGWFRSKPAEVIPPPARTEPSREPRGRGRPDRGGQRPVASQPASTHEVAPTARTETVPEVEALPPALPHADHLQETPVATTPAVLEPAPDSEIVRVEPPGGPPAQVVEPAEATAMPRNAPEIPRVALELPADSGLVLVETTHAAPTAAEETEPSRIRRIRPPRVAIADEPLQLVETTKDSTPPV